MEGVIINARTETRPEGTPTMIGPRVAGEIEVVDVTVGVTDSKTVTTTELKTLDAMAAVEGATAVQVTATRQIGLRHKLTSHQPSLLHHQSHLYLTGTIEAVTIIIFARKETPTVVDTMATRTIKQTTTEIISISDPLRFNARRRTTIISRTSINKRPRFSILAIKQRTLVGEKKDRCIKTTQTRQIILDQAAIMLPIRRDRTTADLACTMQINKVWLTINSN